MFGLLQPDQLVDDVGGQHAALGQQQVAVAVGQFAGQHHARLEVHGAQQRRIGAGEHGVAILAVLGEDTDADACRDRQRLAGNGEGHGDGIENALGEGEGVALVAEVGHHEAEFVAAQPADGIAFPHLQLQATTHFDQDLVADRRAERVVEHPETVEVEQDQRRAPLEAAGGEQCLVEAVGEQGAVGQAGQRVVARQVLDAFGGRLAFGKVAEQADVVADRAGGIAHAGNRQPFVAQRTVLVHLPT